MRQLLLLLALAVLPACTTVTVTADNGARVTIQTDRTVTTLPVTARDNTVPLSAVP